MADRQEAPRLSARAEYVQAMTRLFQATFAEAWTALGRYGLSEADRDDVAQNAVIAAMRRWQTYDEEVGTPGQWLRGVVRNEVRAFLRRKGRPFVEVADELADAGTATPEDAVSLKNLTERLLAVVPVKQRRVVILHEMHGLTFREIAQIEGISPTRTHARYDEGMDLLRAALERWKQDQRKQGLLPVSLAVSTLFATAPPESPPPDAVERAWQRVSRELGLDEGSNEAAPPPESTRVPARRLPNLYLLGPLGALLFAGGMLTSTGLSRCNDPKVHEERAAVIAPLPQTSQAVITAAGAPPQAAISLPPAEPMTTARPPAPPARSRAELDNQRLKDEQALIDQGRSALEEAHFDAAFAAVDEHVRLYPRGQNVAAREQLRADTCAKAPEHPRCKDAQ